MNFLLSGVVRHIFRGKIPIANVYSIQSEMENKNQIQKQKNNDNYGNVDNW